MEVKVFVVEDEAHLNLVSRTPSADEVLANQDPFKFLRRAFAVIGRSQLEQPDDFIHDQLLDWATQWLVTQGHKNQLGFAGFDRHRLIIHAQKRSSFWVLPSVAKGEMEVNGNRPFAIGLAHQNFAASLEQKEPLEDGTLTFMGFVYFFDEPDWPDINYPNRSAQKMAKLKTLCHAETPWVASDIYSRAVGVSQEGGAWIDIWNWENDEGTLKQTFMPFPNTASR